MEIKLKLRWKIISFAWKLCQDALPLGHLVLQRHFRIEGKCAFVCDEIETPLHLFIRCPFLRAVWFGSEPNISFFTGGVFIGAEIRGCSLILTRDVQFMKIFLKQGRVTINLSQGNSLTFWIPKRKARSLFSIKPLDQRYRCCSIMGLCR